MVGGRFSSARLRQCETCVYPCHVGHGKRVSIAKSLGPRIENCCIYLPATKVDFKKLFPGGKSGGGLLKKATRYEYLTADGPVGLNISYARDDPLHLQGFRGFVSQLENTEQQKQQAYELINGV